MSHATKQAVKLKSPQSTFHSKIDAILVYGWILPCRWYGKSLINTKFFAQHISLSCGCGVVHENSTSECCWYAWQLQILCSLLRNLTFCGSHATCLHTVGLKHRKYKWGLNSGPCFLQPDTLTIQPQSQWVESTWHWPPDQLRNRGLLPTFSHLLSGLQNWLSAADPQ